jgi:pimeloyl-ACP methyl ester carboxylesterase
MAGVRDTTGMTPRRRGAAHLVVSLIVMLATVGSVAATSPAFAASSPWRCDSPSGVGQRFPVLLVHGYDSDVTAWSPQTQQYLAGSGSATCIDTFDYGPYATTWVTDPHIGPALANRIVQLASQSTNAGGPGRVIIVAHSMGGLATRCASSPACSGVTDVASKIAALVTFGTPNLGTWLKSYGRSDIADVLGPFFGAACVGTGSGLGILKGVCHELRAWTTSAAVKAFTPGSAQLKALPAIPPSIPVLTAAGSVKVATSFFGHHVSAFGDVGDLIVSEDSALNNANVVDGIGGQTMQDCGYIDVTQPTVLSTWTCWHGTETNDSGFLTVALATITRAERAFATPVLGRPWAPDQSGYGQTRPSFISNGGDPTGVVTDVHWQSWGGTRATGTGTSDYVGPGQDVAGGRQESVTIVAFNLGVCRGRRAYQAIQWYFPQRGDTFDPRHYINICTGQYIDLPSPGAWTGSMLTITPSSLGAVRIGMTQAQSDIAADALFQEQGDGAYSPTLPNGSAYDYVSGFPVRCVGAELSGSPVSQIITTPEGFRLGDSVQRLLAVYGARARYVPPPTRGGITNDAGYVVAEAGGNLDFIIDRTNNTIRKIIGGHPDLGPNDCAG